MSKPLKKVGAKFRECFSGFLSAVDNQEDADRLLSYYTRQQVMFLDAKLGGTFYFLQFSILCFIIGYILIYKQGYLQWEQSLGAVVTHVSGDAVAVSTGSAGTRYFSIGELTYPGLENGNVFVSTRQTVTRQMRGICEDAAMPCLSDADCTADMGGVCTEMGLCREKGWCAVDPEPEIYEINSDGVQIWARSFIQFVKLMNGKLFSTEGEHSGPNKGNTFTLRQLLAQCEPIPVNYEEVAELGAAFEVNFRYQCNVRKDDCMPDVIVRRLDTILDPDNIGFGFKHAEYIDEDHRVQIESRGLRFFFKAHGVGHKSSPAATIMTLSTSMTLLQFALVFADLLLTRVFQNQNKYKARKFEKTPDFGDYIDDLTKKREGAQQLTDIEKAERDVQQKEEDWLRKFHEEL